MQYRLRTLLILLTGVAVALVAIGSPTAFWSGLVVTATVVTLLAAVLIAIYSQGVVRAMALGYLLFCGGYLLYVTVLADNYALALDNGATKMSWLFTSLYDKLHSGSRRLPSYQNTRGNFTVIAHHTLACVLGMAGASLGWWLLTRTRPDSSVE